VAERSTQRPRGYPSYRQMEDDQINGGARIMYNGIEHTYVVAPERDDGLLGEG
jgi:hypothetical protein